jgi:hypothetical protein
MNSDSTPPASYVALWITVSSTSAPLFSQFRSSSYHSTFGMVNHDDHALKVVVPESAVIAILLHAALLETGVLIRMDRDHSCPVSRRGPCHHGPFYARASRSSLTGILFFVCSLVQKQTPSSYVCCVVMILLRSIFLILYTVTVTVMARLCP